MSFIKMFMNLILCQLYSYTVLAASLLRRSESIGGLATGPATSSNLLSPANILAPSTTNSSANILKIACDASRYGKNLKVYSCRNVFMYLRKDPTVFVFAERDSGLPCDVPLPFRTLSSETPKTLLPFRYNAPAWPANVIHLNLTHA